MSLPVPVESEAAIRAAIARESDAWNAGDATAYAAEFAAEGTFTNILGMAFDGRQEFEDRHAEIFGSIFHGSRLTQTVRQLRCIASDVVVVECDTEVTGFAELPPTMAVWPDGALRTRLQQVFAHRDGTWWIEAYHNVTVSPPGDADGR